MIANLNDLMVYISEAEILLRDFRNKQKWISSNYKFGMPGFRKNLKEVRQKKNVDVEQFIVERVCLIFI
jgi:hypothetical protein